MTFTAQDRPVLDRALYRPSHAWATAYILYAICLYGLPATACYLIAMGDWATWLKVITILPLTFLAGYGINMLGFLGHEGTHGSLLRNRKWSAIVGVFFASAVVTYFEMGFAISHWNHHRFTNQKDDPDPAPVKKLDTWWKRILFSRLIYNTIYFKYTWIIASGKPNPLKYKMAYPEKDQILFARLNFLFAAIWLAFYISIAIWDWKAGLFCVLFPLLAVNVIGACQIYIDHAGLDDRFFGNAYSRTSPIMTALFFGANYHLEHHAYPGIPCYRLPKVHRLLVENGTYDKAKPHFFTGFFEAFKPMTLPYNGGDIGQDFDAFAPAFQGDKQSADAGKNVDETIVKPEVKVS